MSPKKGYTIHRAMKGPDIANHQRNAQRNASLLIGHVLSKRKKKDNRYWRGDGETATFLCCWEENRMVQSSCRTVLKFLKNLQIKL